MNSISSQKYIPHVAAIVIFIFLSVGYFFPQFQGKKINQGDTVSYMGMSEEIRQYHEKTGTWSQWTNSMFGGMPSYQILSPNSGNLTSYIKKAFGFGLPRPAGTFIFGMICFYIMCIFLGVSPWLGIIGSIAFAFTTNNLVLYEAGHMTKLESLMSMPLIIAGVILTYRNNRLLGFVLFGLGMAFNLSSNHIQMTYFLAILLLIYTIIVFIDSIRKGRIVDFAKNSGVLTLSLLLAVGTSAGKIWTTYEYSKDTMRGQPILEQKDKVTSSSQVEGLEYEYATAWSNGWRDLLSSYIPLAVGGSSNEKMASNSKFGKELRKVGMKKGPMYWGALPFTSGPVYFGAIIFFLFLLSFKFLDGNLKWWGLISVLLTFLLSLGHNFDAVYKAFFNFAPMFNKFRTPNSILSVTAVIIPFIGILSLDKLFKADREDLHLKDFLVPGVALIIFALLVMFMSGTFFDFKSPGDQRFSQAGLNVSGLVADRKSLMNSSVFRTVILISLTIGLCWLYLKDKLKVNFVILGIGLLILFDLISVGRRYVDSSDFIDGRKYEQNFAMRPVDKQIKSDKDPHYRVLDISINTFNSSSSSFHHKTVGGYHAAKLQRIQDVIDYHISQNNEGVLNMLNTKYIIGAGANQEPSAQQNPGALGNAWFVDGIKFVDNADREIESLSTPFNPESTAIINKEFKDYIGDFAPIKNGQIELVSYAPDRIEYQSKTSSEQLAVFSEVWFGPNKGWQAYIDDQPVDHIRANYILRAMKVPMGTHKIVFEFKPKAYKIGSLISLISSLVFIGLILFSGYIWFKETKYML